MGTGWIGLGQPAADDRHLAGPVSGLVRQEAHEFGRQPGKIRVLHSRRLNLSGTMVTTGRCYVGLRNSPGGSRGTRGRPGRSLRHSRRYPLAGEGSCDCSLDQRQPGQPRPSGLERASCSTS